MVCHSPIFNILLVDDDPQELLYIERIVRSLTGAPVCVDHVVKVSEAVRLLNFNDYDLVLLDNRLSERTSATFSAPFINAAFSNAEIAIISYDIDVPYLHSPQALGVDYVIDKAKLVPFLRDRIQNMIVTNMDQKVTYARRG